MDIKRKLMGGKLITPEQVQRVRELLEITGCIRETARKAGVSYYTATRVNRGVYDGASPVIPLKPTKKPQPDQPVKKQRYFRNNRCWAVGRYL
jgi:hypothetical protein